MAAICAELESSKGICIPSEEAQPTSHVAEGDTAREASSVCSFLRLILIVLTFAIRPSFTQGLSQTALECLAHFFQNMPSYSTQPPIMQIIIYIGKTTCYQPS